MKKNKSMGWLLLGAGAIAAFTLGGKKTGANQSTEAGASETPQNDGENSPIEKLKQVLTQPDNETQNDSRTPQRVPRGGTPPIVDAARPIALPKGMTNEQFQNLRNSGKLLTGKELAAVQLRAKRDLLKKKLAIKKPSISRKPLVSRKPVKPIRIGKGIKKAKGIAKGVGKGLKMLKKIKR